MLITRKSPFTGKRHSMSIDVTVAQLERWREGELIQKVMPHISADEREFIMSGITPEEWDKEFFSEEE